MNKFKLSKIKIIFFVLIIIALILGIFIITNNSELLNNILGEQIYQEGGGVLPLFSYVVCDNQDKDNIKILIRLNSENGLEYVKCPDDQIVYAEGKTQLSIDYTVKENEDKLFSIKEKDKDEVSEVININNDTTQESTLDIERVTDIKGFKSVKLNMKSNLPETYYSNNISYKIGESGSWYTGNAISLLDYDLVRQNLVLANDDGTTTTTLFAKIMDNAGNIVEVSEKLNIDTEVVSESIQEESLLKAIENDNIKTGKYTVEILDKGTTYNLVVYNLEDSIEVVGQLNIGTTEDVATSSTEYAKNMVVLKVNGDLNVVEDATLTSYATIYGGPKGMTVYCTGTLNNNGKITMTARGAYAQGQDVYLWKNADETKGYEYVPATGASGAARVYVDNGKKDGSAGSNGKDRSTGGGGSGSTRDANANGGSATSGAGKSGTSYSGGTGGGAAANPGYENHGFTAYDATDYGGARRSWKTY